MPAYRMTPNHRVLLVDDNHNGLAVRKALLEEDGHHVTPVDNPVVAIELFRSAPHDLVITDYRMPEMDGVEFIAQIRKIDSEVPILLVSGFVGILDLEPAHIGADAVLRKDAQEASRLKRIVKVLIRRKCRVGARDGLLERAGLA
jgi:CheY-like chemotaxis protein